MHVLGCASPRVYDGTKGGIMPEDTRGAIMRDALYWIDSIEGYASYDGKRWRSYASGRFIALTWDDISTLGSCLGF